ncbi:RNA cap guanine-N2 methyltransferase-domain-containing protein [Fomitopsis serialis]|uniref:RNA cap guanine-N2 methyltransferase-domain-containing protein n=1 Tax=Fomitopsis serialis TaxID=139415 RepID=UPI0020072D82|nr:RNA cap guanine-N2 methyltransferase-domain-containing protein [Neoantrodia serialis]KAH9926931.1 RNA cap guanine-N2 methyltransferase-domain-containing protein [Neoantrodia serialis]
MGKKNANLSGLARFVADAFGPSSLNTTATSSPPSDPVSSVRGTGHEPSADRTPGEISTGTVRRATEAAEDGVEVGFRPSKKRKVGPGKEQYDARGLVPFYQHPSQVPAHLQKYFSQRERYFSLYSSGCLLDEEGWYSVTPERIANQIAERCRCDVVLDAFCGVGGNAIAFAKTCERVIALDISPVRLALARHNAEIYGVADRIEFILADFFSFARTLVERQTAHANSGDPDSQSGAAQSRRKIDVIFLSPPWGGPSYLTDKPHASDGDGDVSGGSDDKQAPHEFSLSSIRPVHGKELFETARSITRNVAYFLPRNVKLDEISALVAEEQTMQDGDYVPAQRQQGKGKEKAKTEMIEVEEEWMGSKLKALTCYFGGLASGQEDQFYS